MGKQAGNQDVGDDGPVERAVAAERRRLAREIHDVLAHQLTATVLQAEGAAAVLDADPSRALAYLETIEQTARASLDELRGLLGVLREGEAIEPPHRTPPAETTPDPAVRELLGIQVVVHRIVQEALTNVSRHAGLADVSVAVRVTDEGLEVEVTNGPSRQAPPGAPEGSRVGMRGMRERTEQLGGTFESGPTPEGGWTVRATIPRSAGPASG